MKSESRLRTPHQALNNEKKSTYKLHTNSVSSELSLKTFREDVEGKGMTVPTSRL